MITNKITYSKNNEYVHNLSRYKILRKITENDDTQNSYLETQNQRFVAESDKDIYHIVKDNEVNRLDLIALKYYDNANLWWAIALANEFIDPFVLAQGTLIRIPSVITLNDATQRILSR